MKKFSPNKPPFHKYKSAVFKDAAKVSSFIFQIGDSASFRQKSKEISFEKITSEEMKEKMKYVKKRLTRYRSLTGKGRGLTAVQIGIPECFSVIYMPGNLLIIINPIVTKISKKKYRYPEICMSANPIIAPVVRPAWIEFDYYTENGKKAKWDMKDDTETGKILNRVMQHEIDHMHGTINIDLVSSKELILESDPNFYDNAKFEEI